MSKDKDKDKDKNINTKPNKNTNTNKTKNKKTILNQNHSLTAISPLDGRYKNKTSDLAPIFSEYGLIYYRLLVEIQWFIALSKNPDIKQLPELKDQTEQKLLNILQTFDLEEAQKVKEIEKTTNHDVKAVEYYLQDFFKSDPNLKPYICFIHFGCTSEDINNCAHGLMLKAGRKIILEQLSQITNKIFEQSKLWHKIPMMARTHGQPASPTTLGKEWMNVLARIERQIKTIKSIKVMAKINGAVGNFNAHTIAYPNIDWNNFSEKFINDLGLSWQQYTTQIEPHDYMSELFDAIARTNNILLDFSKDCWGYISIGYFTQKLKAGEIGSSTMPHKVNPIDFENAEGNLGLANAILKHMSQKLPISRWQRDLTDSTVLRNMGLGFGYANISCKSLLAGLSKLEVNQSKISQDLDNQWALLGEAIQTVMRKYGISDAYEQLKAFTRGKDIDQRSIQDFIKQLDLPQEQKDILLKLKPSNYLGILN